MLSVNYRIAIAILIQGEKGTEAGWRRDGGSWMEEVGGSWMGEVGGSWMEEGRRKLDGGGRRKLDGGGTEEVGWRR